MNRTALSPSLDLASELSAVDDETSLRILLAEDNRQLRRLLTLILRRDGHEVVEIADGAELLEAFASMLTQGGHDYDLVISEQCLPGIPGVSALAGLRTWDRATPFVLITADPDVQEKARRLGAIILDHPFNVQAIRAAVRESTAAVPREGALA
jgi:CheY-like chemotaxis protein